MFLVENCCPFLLPKKTAESPAKAERPVGIKIADRLKSDMDKEIFKKLFDGVVFSETAVDQFKANVEGPLVFGKDKFDRQKFEIDGLVVVVIGWYNNIPCLTFKSGLKYSSAAVHMLYTQGRYLAVKFNNNENRPTNYIEMKDVVSLRKVEHLKIN